MRTRRLALILGTILSLLSLLAGVLVMPGRAQAAGPEHTNFSGTATGVDACGITVTVAFAGVDNFFPVFDSSGTLISVKDTHEERDTLTAANGKSVESHTAFQTTSSLTVNPDGTVTIVSTFKGLPEQLSTPNGPVLTKDVGFIRFVNVFDSSFHLISQTITVENGPHPDADSGSTLFCQVVTAALS
jgi:hypothetical protein